MVDFLSQDEVDALLKGVTGEDEFTKSNVLDLLRTRRDELVVKKVEIEAKISELTLLLNRIQKMREVG